MSDKILVQRRPWTLRRKLLIGGITALIVLGLALGLGLGLTLGRDNGDDDDNGQPTLSPLPKPGGSLPWTPKVNDTWQIILSHPPSISPQEKTTTPDVSIFDIDLFDTPADTIKQLHTLGKKVICYFSAGSYEEWRPDAKEFKPEDLGKQLDDWPGEKWLKLSSPNVRNIMKKRVDLAKQKGCDGIDPDNVDAYQNQNGLGLTSNDSVSYLEYLSSLARPLNLTMGLKNAGDIISAVLPIVDFSVNEQCMQYDECSTFRRFVDAGKPVFHIEYPAGDGGVSATGFKEDIRKKYCRGQGDPAEKDGTDGFSTVLKKMELDGWVEYCDGNVVQTAVNETVGGHDSKKQADSSYT